MASSRAIRKLDNGEPHFRYLYLGKGEYSVFAAVSGGDVYLGRIRTESKISAAVDPGKWRVSDAPPLDSMNQAAAILLAAAKDEQFRVSGLELVA